MNLKKKKTLKNKLSSFVQDSDDVMINNLNLQRACAGYISKFLLC